jgi:RNA polymerase sigma-70 factor, ECF subfamily
MAEVVQLPRDRPEADGDADEGALVSLASAGDRRAFETLYRRHAPRVYGLCRRLAGRDGLAEDCVQDAFIAAWRALPTFERRSRFSTWLHRIAVNAVLANRRLPRETPVQDGAVPQASHRDGTDTRLDLERAIARLPAGARDVFVLVGLYGYSHDEAAELLGHATGTSKAQLHRARQLLAADLQLPSEST